MSQSSIQCLLQLRVSSLLEDLDEDELVRSLEPKICILANDLVRLVLSDDLADVSCAIGSVDSVCSRYLIAVSMRSVELVEEA